MRIELRIAACELRRLLRDRRALMFAVVLPMLLYPVLIFASGKLEEVSEERVEAKTVGVLVDLSGLDEVLREPIQAALTAQGENLEWEPAELPELVAAGRALAAERDALDALEAPDLERTEALETQRAAYAEQLEEALGDDRQLVLAADGAQEPPLLELIYDGADEDGQAARGRVRELLRGLERELVSARVVEWTGADPQLQVRPRRVDVAAAEDASGAALGRFLPLIAVLMLVSGGAFCALDAFAAEREVGTLETLLVQPVERTRIAFGKFLAVLVVGFAAFAGNAGSLVACAALGLMDNSGAGGLVEGLGSGAFYGRMALALFLFLPTVALVSAILCWLSARAKSFREGQNYIFPLTLACLALTAPALSPELEFGAALALAPVTGPALAMREALAGRIAWVPSLITFVSSLGWAWLALRSLADTLDAERLLAPPKQGNAQDARASNRPLAFGGLSILALYLVGGSWQAKDPIGGLIGSLWLIVLGLGLWAAWDASKRYETSLVSVLGLDRLAPLACLGALLAAPGLGYAMQRLLELQNRLLPMADTGPLDAAFAPFMELSPLALFALIAISPGICEELLCRGALLFGLRSDRPAKQAVFWQALIFAALHASVFRLAPTFLLGALFGALRLRARSIVPCMVLHTAYNGSLAMSAEDGPVGATWLLHPAWLIATVVGLGLAFRASRED
ncbi:MAG: CPBP family glutamic-type intramembrane protease [Planctomycetota bacterium]|jgi:sodium transport system permease protein